MIETNFSLGPTKEKIFSFTYLDLTALGAVASSFIPLLNIPSGCVLLGYRIKGTKQFTTTGSGTLKVQLGYTDSTAAAQTFGSQSADLIGTSVTDIAPLTEGPLFALGQITAAVAGDALVGTASPAAATSVGINVVSSVSNFSLLTAGTFDIYICFQSSLTVYPYKAFDPTA